MSVAHSAHFASPPYPLPSGEGIGEGIGEGFTSSGQPVGPHREPVGEALAAIRDRLAVVAVAAHIMERRAPRDVYARSIARETQALALAVRELHREASTGAPMHAPRIVEATPDTAPDGEHDARELCSFPGCCHWYNDPCADCGATARGSSRRSTAQKRRQTPPDARQRATGAQASDSAARTDASPQPSRASSGAKGGAQ